MGKIDPAPLPCHRAWPRPISPDVVKLRGSFRRTPPMNLAPLAGGVVRLVRGVHHDPTAARTPIGHVSRNRSVIFRLFVSDHKSSRSPDRFRDFEKVCADVALSAPAPVFWSRSPQLTPPTRVSPRPLAPHRSCLFQKLGLGFAETFRETRVKSDSRRLNPNTKS